MVLFVFPIIDSCQSVVAVGEAYKRLCGSRDFFALIQQISLPTMDKIPFISRLIHSFMVLIVLSQGPGISDIDRVRHFLDLKVFFLIINYRQ